MFWTLELATYLEDAPLKANYTKVFMTFGPTFQPKRTSYSTTTNINTKSYILKILPISCVLYLY